MLTSGGLNGQVVPFSSLDVVVDSLPLNWKWETKNIIDLAC